MSRYAQRFGTVLAVLAALSFLIFYLSTLIPGDLATILVGSEGATREQFEELREELGLDDPLPLQYLRWLSGAVRFDFGTSPITGRDVSSDLATQIPVSFELALLALISSTLVGMPAGILASRYANKMLDVAIRVSLLFAFSVPVFVSGILVVLITSQHFPSIYTSTYVPIQDGIGLHLRSLVLPLAVITLPLAALTMQMVRGAMLDQVNSDYVRLARAKGASEGRVYFIHAAKNALPPVITLLGYQFGVLVRGLFVVEVIFNLPGLGRGLLTAISVRDYPAVAAITLVLTAAFLIGNAIADMLQPAFDPRQRS